jgi:hypothetical protein
MSGAARQIMTGPVKAAMPAPIVVASQAQKGHEKLADNHGAAGNGAYKVNGIHGEPFPFVKGKKNQTSITYSLWTRRNL